MWNPTIGITIGDPGSIGPEIVLKALAAAPAKVQYVMFGSRRVLDAHAAALRLPAIPEHAQFVDVDNVPKPFFGPQPVLSGQASIDYLEAAFDWYHEGKIDALVTGPIHKESWHAAGHDFPGQTEYCAGKTGTQEFCMLMVGASFRIALLSTHLSLREALSLIRAPRIVSMAKLVYTEFEKLGFSDIRILVAALNPHAGEAGAFGSEEQAEIIPAIRELQSQGLPVQGPIAPEVVFRVAAREKREGDVILAMYHDQAMIPLKLLDFHTSANVTLGLPLIRTSPDHGTAFDIAGQGIADERSMQYAIRIAIDWTLRKKS